MIEFPDRHRHADAAGVVSTYLALLFLIPSVYVIGPFGAIGTPASLLGLGCFLWWMVGRILPGAGLDLARQPVRVATFLFVGSILLSFSLANARGPLQGDEFQSADRGVLFVFSLLGVTLLAADGIDSVERLRTLYRRLVTLAAWVAIVGLGEYIVKINFITTVFDVLPGLKLNGQVEFAGARSEFTSIRRVSGTAIHPIEFGVVLSMVLPIAAHMALHDAEHRGLRRWWKVGVIFVAEPMAQSRSGLLVLFIASLVLIPAWPKAVRRTLLKSVPLILVGMRVVFPGLLGTIRNLFLYFSSDSSFTSRTDDYKLVPTFIGQHPWFGRGFGTFLPSEFFFLDNQYIMSTIETGYVGLLILIGLLLCGFGTAVQARRWAIHRDDKLLAHAVAASIIGTTLAFGTFDFLSFPLATGTLFVIIGSAGAMWRLNRSASFEVGRVRPTRLTERIPIRLRLTRV